MQSIIPNQKSPAWKNETWKIETIPSFCITIERRHDRWKRFQDQSGIDGLHLKRFLGVDGKTLDAKTDDRIAVLTKRNILSKSRRSHEELDSIGGVGCALSHIAVWQWMVDNQQEVCLVFEDDAVVPPTFIQQANECIEQSTILKHPKQWDMWLLGGKWDDMSRIPGETATVRIGAFVLFHAYVMTLSCAKRLLQSVYPIHAHIDTWVSIYAYMNDLRLIGCNSLKLEQNNAVKTDIQSEDGCKICNVPTAFDKTHQMISKNELMIARVSEVLCVGLIAYFIYKRL